MDRLSSLTERLQVMRDCRALVAMATAGYVGRGDSSLRALHFQRCMGASYFSSIQKAGVDATGLSSDLGAPRELVAAFVTAVARTTVLGRIQEALRVPRNTCGKIQTTQAVARWVEEFNVKPVAHVRFANLDLLPKTVEATVVVSDELVRVTAGSTLDSLARQLVAAVAAAVDVASLDPTSAASGGRPASLTNSGTEVVSTGVIEEDIGLVLQAISGGAPQFPYLVTDWAAAARLAPRLRDLADLGAGVALALRPCVSASVSRRTSRSTMARRPPV